MLRYTRDETRMLHIHLNQKNLPLLKTEKKFSNFNGQTRVYKEAATGSVLYQILFCLQTSNFIKKRLQHRCFHVNIAKFIRTPILKNICEWLLLSKGQIRTDPYFFCMHSLKIFSLTSIHIFNLSLSLNANIRSSLPQLLCKKSVLKSFIKLTGKYLHLF